MSAWSPLFSCAEGGNTITLVGDVSANTEISITKSLTIDGQGHKMTLTAGAGSQALSIGSDSARSIKVTFDNVGLTINGTQNTSADGIDVWAEFNITGSKIEMSGLRSAFVMQGGMDAKVNLDGSTVNVHDITGNGSNGGVWAINNSEMTFTNVESHAMSTEELAVTDSDLIFNNIGLVAVYGQKIDFNDGVNVVIANGGTSLPSEGYDGTVYNQPIQIKTVEDVTGNYLTVDDGASVSITGKNDGIYVPAGTTFTNNGVVNAEVVMAPAPAGQHTVEVIDNGMTIAAEYVADNGSFTLPDTPTRSGYTFRGWLCGGKLYDSGDQVTVISDMTFTAVWDAINIPDTYPIDLVVSDGGDAKLNFTNASQGTVITVTVTPDEGYRLDYITVDGERISGTSFKMPDHSVTVRVYFTDGTVAFADVSRTDWFYNYVQYVVSNGLMEGTSATTFEPNANMSRAMVWTILARIDGETVTGANWITTARAWAMANGVSDGENANGAVTREQLATMLWRYAGEPVSSYSLGGFTDATSVSDYAATAMAWAVESGIITGMTDTTLAPQGTATRAQCAAMLMRFVEL